MDKIAEENERLKLQQNKLRQSPNVIVTTKLRESLPAFSMKQELLETILKNQVKILYFKKKKLKRRIGSNCSWRHRMWQDNTNTTIYTGRDHFKWQRSLM